MPVLEQRLAILVSMDRTEGAHPCDLLRRQDRKHLVETRRKSAGAARRAAKLSAALSAVSSTDIPISSCGVMMARPVRPLACDFRRLRFSRKAVRKRACRSRSLSVRHSWHVWTMVVAGFMPLSQTSRGRMTSGGRRRDQGRTPKCPLNGKKRNFHVPGAEFARKWPVILTNSAPRACAAGGVMARIARPFGALRPIPYVAAEVLGKTGVSNLAFAA